MKRTTLSLITCAIAFSSCAVEELTFVEKAPVKPTKETPAVEPTLVPIPDVNPDVNNDDGFRLPDMLAMPEDEQLRSTPGASSREGDGTIIAQPPKE